MLDHAGQKQIFIIDDHIDIALVTESWLSERGDEGKIADLTPSTHMTKSFPRTGRKGGRICVIFAKHLEHNLFFKKFAYISFEAVEIYRLRPPLFLTVPGPNRQNHVTDRMFLDEFSDLLASFQSAFPDNPVFTGDMNFHYNDPSETGQSTRSRPCSMITVCFSWSMSSPILMATF